MDSWVLHLDIDAFFASVEQVRNPALRGRPVVVGNGVIASCSYEAREFGLRAAMSLREARRLCPHAVILDGSYPVYRCFTDRIFELCRRWSFGQETYLDEAYLDYSGLTRALGPPERSARRLKEEIRAATGLPVTIGVATNRMVAKMASKCAKPDGLLKVERGGEDGFVRSRRLEDLPGIGPRTLEELALFHVSTIEELRALPREVLRGVFGPRTGEALHERCRGQDSRVVSPREVPLTISRETSFHKETADPAELTGMLHYLAERAMRAARRLGLGVRSVETHLRYADGRAESGTRTLPEPTVLDEEVFEQVLASWRALHTRRVNVRLVGITLSRFVPERDFRGGLFADERRERKGRLYGALDRVRDRFGYGALVTGRSLDLVGKLRHDPHGFVLRTPSLTK